MQAYRFFIFLLIAETYVTVTIANNQLYTTCNTDECKNAASKVLSKLDTTVDPCDNFYKFACGGWIANHSLAPSEMHKTVFTMLDGVVKEQTNEILADTQKPNDTVAVQRARDIYKICMGNAESDLDEIGALDEFAQRFGQWPITLPSSEWNINNNVSWQDMIGKIYDDSFEHGLFSIRVRTNSRNSSTHIIIITQPVPFIGRDIYESFSSNIEGKTKYKNYIEAVAQAFVVNRGSNVAYDSMAKDALDIVNFESELLQLTKTSGELTKFGNPFTQRTVHQWQEDYDTYVGNSTDNTMNWLDLLQRIFQPYGITISSSDTVMIPAWPFFQEKNICFNALQEFSLQEERSLFIGSEIASNTFNYVQWSFIRNQVPYTTKTLEDLSINIKKEFLGIEIPTSRWEICVDIPNLSTAVSYEYAKKYVQPKNKEDVIKIIEDIKEAVKVQITGNSWMDEATKDVSIEKLDYTGYQISTPDWYTKEAIDNLYENLTTNDFTTLGYCKSLLKVQAFNRQKMLNLLEKPVDKNRWPYEPTIADAFYMINVNKILIAAAIMQDPIYNATHPMVMNYGSIGCIIGHEINHAFDNFGRRFDKNGNKVNWWTNKTSDEYNLLTECFVDQYNGYKVPGLESLEQDTHVNGLLTLGENIGDSAGIIAAYQAYKNKKEQLQESETRLPGLEKYSEDQLFFMSYGQILCENISLDKTLMLLSDVHPRSETRVRGTLSNMIEFSKVYACPVGTNMNPAKKCTLW